jgi:hypothetical protein
MSVTIEVNQGVVDNLFGETGPLAAFLVGVMESVVIPEATDALSVPAIRFSSNRLSDAALRSEPNLGAGAGLIRNTWAPNPPPGPPFRRTGDLINSLGVSSPVREGRWLVVYGTANATHGGFLYPEHLRKRGYQFFPLGDPRFNYHGDSEMAG